MVLKVCLTFQCQILGWNVKIQCLPVINTTCSGEYYVILLVPGHKWNRELNCHGKKKFLKPNLTCNIVYDLNSDVIHPNNCQWK